MNIEKMKVQMCVECRNMFQVSNGECSKCGRKEFETHWVSTEDDGDYLFRLVSHVGSEETHDTAN